MTHLLEKGFQAVERGRRFVTHDVWHVGGPGEVAPRGFVIRQIRVVILVAKGVIRDDLLLRAAALTFATMLAIVPFLAIMFYLIQTFNVADSVVQVLSLLVGEKADAAFQGGEARNVWLWRQFIGLLFQGFEAGPPGETGAPMENPVAIIIQSAERSANPRALTLAGVVFVLTTVFGMMFNIEGSFNTIWGTRRSKSWLRTFGDYVKILVLLPFVTAGVLGLITVLESPGMAEALGPFTAALRGVQYVVAWVVFSALYYVTPNTRVRFRYALFAGIVAGTAWSLLSLAYVRFQFGLPRYNLLYSTFAQVPVLLGWLYLSWLILLSGAELTFACQNEQTFAMERLAEGASYAYREALGLWAMVEIGRRFDAGRPNITVEEAAREWNVPSRLVNDTLNRFEDAGLVVKSAQMPPTYQPARSLDRITVHEVLAALREAGDDPSSLRSDPQFLAVFNRVHATRDLRAYTLAALVRETAPAASPGAAPAPESLPETVPPESEA